MVWKSLYSIENFGYFPNCAAANKSNIDSNSESKFDLDDNQICSFDDRIVDIQLQLETLVAHNLKETCFSFPADTTLV